jgi:hypothetical protein
MVFQCLPATKQPLKFLGITEIAAARAGNSQYSFKAEFYYEKADLARGISQIVHDYAWVNLSFLPVFVPDSEWQDRVKIRNPPNKYKKVKEIDAGKFKTIADLRSGQQKEGNKFVRVSEFVSSWAATTIAPHRKFSYGPTLFSNHKVPFAIATSEVCRFYISAFGLIFFELVRAVEDDTSIRKNPLESLVEIERCGWDPRERGTYRICPKVGLQDRAAALQIAVLLTDRALCDAVVFMIRAFRHQAEYGSNGALLAFFPPESSPTLALECGEPISRVAGNSQVHSFLPVRRIRKDERPLKFKKLIIETIDTNPIRDLDSTDNNSGKDCPLPVFGETLKVTDILPNNGSKRQIGDTGPSFTDCFPSARSIVFRIEQVEPSTRRQRLRKRTRSIYPFDKATLSEVYAPDGIAKFAFARDEIPLLEAHDDDKLQEQRAFFPANLPPGMVNIVRYPRQFLNSRLKAFCEARALLIQEGVAQAVFGDESSEVEPVIVPPPSWGSFAVSKKYGPRSIGLMCIPTDGRTYYAIELGQMHSQEYVSMAIMAKKSGATLELEEVYAFMADACLKRSRNAVASSQRDARTIWPSPKHYNDIVVIPVMHRARLARSGALRRAILETISWLEFERSAKSNV